MKKFLLKIIFRNFFRQKIFSLINILGLAIGMAAFILIMLWVEDELSFEECHENADNIFMLFKGYSIGGKSNYNSSLPLPLAPYAAANLPQVERTVRIIDQGAAISFGDKVFNESDFIYTDTSFFDVFTIKVLTGNRENFLKEAHTVVISKSLATKYFGDEDPLGKTLTMDQATGFVVEGIFDDLPENTYIKADIIAGIDAFPRQINYSDDWGNHFVTVFYLLNDSKDVSFLERETTDKIRKELETEQINIRLHPIKKLHLYSVSGKNEGLQYVITFTLIAVFIIIIAGINFMNLTTAKYSNRAKEIGLKKVAGATRGEMIRQFLGESLFMALIAAILAMTLAELLRPWFNGITGKTITFRYTDVRFVVRLVALVAIVGLFSGSYPALILSRFQPASILRRDLQSGEKGALFRKILVLVQFGISTVLMFSVVIIYRQISFMQNKDPGYQTQDILYLPVDGKIGSDYESFRSDLLASPYIEDAGRCSELPCRISWIIRDIRLEGREAEGGMAFAVSSIDYGYISTLRLPLIDGRSFARDLKSDSAGIIFNEEAIGLIGWDRPVGRSFVFNEDEKSTIIGVVKDFHSQPLTNEMEPLVFLIWESTYNYVLVRVAPGMAMRAKEYIESLWPEYASGYPFNCNHLETYIKKLYRNEVKVGKLAAIMTLLALFISSLGLTGLTAFIIEKKYKEIGLRKIFGSSVIKIQYLVSSHYLKWVIIATLLALPISWYLMAIWLGNFAYRIEIGFSDFFITVLMTFTVALLITSVQVMRASRMKPVDVLKYE